MDIPAIPELTQRLRTLFSEEEAVRLGYVFGSQVDGGHPRGGGELRPRHGEGGVRPVPIRPIGPSSVVIARTRGIALRPEVIEGDERYE